MNILANMLAKVCFGWGDSDPAPWTDLDGRTRMRNRPEQRPCHEQVSGRTVAHRAGAFRGETSVSPMACH